MASIIWNSNDQKESNKTSYGSTPIQQTVNSVPTQTTTEKANNIVEEQSSMVVGQHYEPETPPEPTPTQIVEPTYTPPVYKQTQTSCCKICSKGKACWDSCINRSYTCHKWPGCACDG